MKIISRLSLLAGALIIGSSVTLVAQFSNSMPGVITTSGGFSYTPPAALPQAVVTWSGTNVNPNGSYYGGLGSLYNQFLYAGGSNTLVSTWVKTSSFGNTNWVQEPGSGGVAVTNISGGTFNAVVLTASTVSGTLNGAFAGNAAGATNIGPTNIVGDANGNVYIGPTHGAGTANTAIGTNALGSNTGSFNSANGGQALAANTTGQANTASGNQALFLNTTGNNNTANGGAALFSNQSGANNSAQGDQALYSNTTGNNNTASGYKALLYNTTGNGNIALGLFAGTNIVAGSNNLDIAASGTVDESRIGRIGTSLTDLYLGGIIHGLGSGLSALPAASVVGALTNNTTGNSSTSTLSSNVVSGIAITNPVISGATISGGTLSGVSILSGALAGNGIGLNNLSGTNILGGLTNNTTGNAATSSLSTNVVSGIAITNPVVSGATITGSMFAGNAAGATNLNSAFSQFAAPTNPGTVGSIPVVTLNGLQLQPQIDLSGPISVNANPTTWGYTNTFAISVSPNATSGHGEIQLSMATLLGASDASNGWAAATDGNPLTYWQDGGASKWIGIDIGAGNTATLTRFRYMPITTGEFDNNTPEYYSVLALAQTIQDAAGDNPTNQSPQIPGSVWQPRGKWLEVLCTNLGSYPSRYFRVMWPTTGGGLAQDNLPNGLAEFRLIGTGSLNGQPVAPFISPWGGHFTNNAVLVTIKDISTAASIYWTTNAWATSNLYSGPFVLTPLGSSQSTGIHLQAIAQDNGLTTPLSEIASNAWFYSTGYVPLDDWRDDSGYLIEAHSGGILDDRQNGNGWFLIGDFMNMAEATSGNDIIYYPGECAYHSLDLLNWTFAGWAATNTAGFNGISGNPNYTSVGWIQRFHSIYNAPYHYYAAWAHGVNPQSPFIFTSSTPNGPYSQVSTNSFLSGTVAVTNIADDNLYLDYDGSAYFFYGSNSPSTSIWVTKLNPAFTAPIGSSVQITNFISGSREAPAAFRFPYNSSGICFCVDSKGNFYSSANTFQEAYCFSTNGFLGQWYYGGLLFAIDPVNLAGLVPTNYYNAQISQIFPSPWNTNQLIAVADFWYTNSSQVYNIYTGTYGPNATLRNSRQVWLPLTVNGTTLSVATNSNWQLQEWNKVFEIPANNISLGQFTYVGNGCGMWNSNNSGVLYWVTSTHTNYVSGP